MSLQKKVKAILNNITLTIASTACLSDLCPPMFYTKSIIFTRRRWPSPPTPLPPLQEEQGELRDQAQVDREVQDQGQLRAIANLGGQDYGDCKGCKEHPTLCPLCPFALYATTTLLWDLCSYSATARRAFLRSLFSCKIFSSLSVSYFLGPNNFW